MYQITRTVFLRLLACLYAVAFFILIRQGKPLLGRNGILPIDLYLSRVQEVLGSGSASFAQLPSLFWFGSSDSLFTSLAWTGFLLATASIALVQSSVFFFLLWVVYLSFVNVGQIFYGYGWESLLLEMGFLAIFLSPLWNLKPVPEEAPPSPLLLLLLRWILFRLMFGAGLIKLRGDPCWSDLSCMNFHYETQPLPNPMSWYFHRLPSFFHQFSVLLTHFVEVVLPFGVFGPRQVRIIVGLIQIGFQGSLILSGNLSFLNYLTIVLCVACFDDGFFQKVSQVLTPWLPSGFWKRSLQNNEIPQSIARKTTTIGLTGFILILSINPTLNLFSKSQLMNASFDPLHIVNTYGAFGSIGRNRNEIILQGAEDPSSESTWKDYEFNCKPGDPNRHPCVVSPYHYRLDWQMWFAAMTSYEEQPWFLHLVTRLLEGQTGVGKLLAKNPFPNSPPRYIRAELYSYSFASGGDPKGAWWHRERISSYLPPVSLEDPLIQEILSRYQRR